MCSLIYCQLSILKMNIILLLLLMFINIICAEDCTHFKTCGDCMGSPKVCVWCSDEKHKAPRCIKKSSSNNKLWCKDFVDFESSTITNVNNDQSGHLVPQKIKAQVRPGEKLKFNFSYKPAKDHALDIYFLIDGSYTMKFHLNKIQEQAEKIKNTLTKITNNVRFGVGTFVEKFALPYGFDTSQSLFHNHLSLSEDIDKFRRVVKNIKSTGNLDIPEAGLDALMQVMVCQEIGWRTDARRIVILATDSPYHSAGDGKMVGTFKPNDKQCYMYNNSYDRTTSLTYDYPSVYQIDRVANDKGINILFAVIEQVINVYVALSRHIMRSECVKLSKSSYLDQILKDQYTKLQQKMQLDYHSSMPKDSFKLYIDKGLTEAHSYGVNQKVHVNAELEILKCPKKDKYHLVIGSKDLHGENLSIDIEINCKCRCENKTMVQYHSAYCNSKGSFECGVCRCEQERYGENCECTGNMTTEEAIAACKAKSDDAAVCSGRGKCICGECKSCTDNYDGKYCEYSSRDCLYYRDEPCGGKGKCENKVCKCYPNWTGDDCSCPLDVATCIGPNSKVCSGNGACKCGECVCTTEDPNGVLYKGKYCNYCDSCAVQRCKELEDYVVCYYNKLNETNTENAKQACDTKYKHTTEYNVVMLNKTELNSEKCSGAYWCKKILEDKTSIIFKYQDNIGNTLILIQKEKDKEPSPKYWIPIAISIGTVLLVGLLTVIIWKVCMDIHDAREYEKFAQESAKQGFDVSLNPLYHSPAININNPAYCKDFN